MSKKINLLPFLGGKNSTDFIIQNEKVFQYKYKKQTISIDLSATTAELPVLREVIAQCLNDIDKSLAEEEVLKQSYEDSKGL